MSAPGRLRQLSAQLAPSLALLAPSPAAAALLTGGSGAMEPTDIMMGGIWCASGHFAPDICPPFAQL